MTESTEQDLREDDNPHKDQNAELARRLFFPEDDEDPASRAFAAYFEAEGDLAPQPSRETSWPVVHDGRRYVVLRNVNGVLAVYRVRPDGVLKRLKRWPAEIEAY